MSYNISIVGLNSRIGYATDVAQSYCTIDDRGNHYLKVFFLGGDYGIILV